MDIQNLNALLAVVRRFVVGVVRASGRPAAMLPVVVRGFTSEGAGAGARFAVLAGAR